MKISINIDKLAAGVYGVFYLVVFLLLLPGLQMRMKTRQTRYVGSVNPTAAITPDYIINPSPTRQFLMNAINPISIIVVVFLVFYIGNSIRLKKFNKKILLYMVLTIPVLIYLALYVLVAGLTSFF